MERDKEIVKESQKIVVRKYKNGVYRHEEAMNKLIDLDLTKVEARNRLVIIVEDYCVSDQEMRDNYHAEQHNQQMEQDWQDQF